MKKPKKETSKFQKYRLFPGTLRPTFVVNKIFKIILTFFVDNFVTLAVFALYDNGVFVRGRGFFNIILILELTHIDVQTSSSAEEKIQGYNRGNGDGNAEWYPAGFQFNVEL